MEIWTQHYREMNYSKKCTVSTAVFENTSISPIMEKLDVSIRELVLGTYSNPDRVRICRIML